LGGTLRRFVTIVRRLTVDDLAAYRALHRLGLAEGSGAFVESLEEDAARPDAALIAMLARGEGWGAFQDGRLDAKLTIDHVPYAVLAHTRWLHAMYARPEARGSGAAAALVRTVIDDARRAGAIRFMLWVSAENERARRFYETLGFRESGRVPAGIRSKGRYIDDVMMCLAIDEA
jgi:RimJ/RimL family protein N-acetyltransferase